VALRFIRCGRFDGKTPPKPLPVDSTVAAMTGDGVGGGGLAQGRKVSAARYSLFTTHGDTLYALSWLGQG